MGQDLQRHLPVELRVGGLVDLPNAPQGLWRVPECQDGLLRPAHSIHAISSATQTGHLDHGTNRGTVLTETATLEAGHREHARSAGILRVLQPWLMRSSTDESCRGSHCREDRRDRRSRPDTHRTYSPSTPRCPAGPIPARRMRRWCGPLQAHRARGSPSVRPTRAPRPACTCAAAPTPRTAFLKPAPTISASLSAWRNS